MRVALVAVVLTAVAGLLLFVLPVAHASTTPEPQHVSPTPNPPANGPHR